MTRLHEMGSENSGKCCNHYHAMVNSEHPRLCRCFYQCKSHPRVPFDFSSSFERILDSTEQKMLQLPGIAPRAIGQFHFRTQQHNVRSVHITQASTFQGPSLLIAKLLGNLSRATPSQQFSSIHQLWMLDQLSSISNIRATDTHHAKASVIRKGHPHDP